MSKTELKTEISDFEKDIELIMSGEKALSYSACSAFLKSPKHFYEYKTDKETTPAMIEGQMFHMACLEPDKFKAKYWVLDDTDKCIEIGGAKPRSTNKYKEWVTEQDLLHKGQERVSKELYDTFMRMSEALKKNKSSGKYMNNLIGTETDFELNHDGFLLRGKVDGHGENEDGEFLIDLKKVADASYKKVRWNITDMNYDLQGGLYSKGCNIDRYFLIFIDKACNITVVKLIPETLETGFVKLENCLSEFTRCAEENAWNDSYDFFNGGYIQV